MSAQEMFEIQFTDHTPQIDVRTPSDVKAQKEAGTL